MRLIAATPLWSPCTSSVYRGKKRVVAMTSPNGKGRQACAYVKSLSGIVGAQAALGLCVSAIEAGRQYDGSSWQVGPISFFGHA